VESTTAGGRGEARRCRRAEDTTEELFGLPRADVYKEQRRLAKFTFGCYARQSPRGGNVGFPTFAELKRRDIDVKRAVTGLLLTTMLLVSFSEPAAAGSVTVQFLVTIDHKYQFDGTPCCTPQPTTPIQFSLAVSFDDTVVKSDGATISHFGPPSFADIPLGDGGPVLSSSSAGISTTSKSGYEVSATAFAKRSTLVAGDLINEFGSVRLAYQEPAIDSGAGVTFGDFLRVLQNETLQFAFFDEMIRHPGTPVFDERTGQWVNSYGPGIYDPASARYFGTAEYVAPATAVSEPPAMGAVLTALITLACAGRRRIT
jgi:hypothetical protein